MATPPKIISTTEYERRFLAMLEESQYWPADRLVAYQREQLAPLLRHARLQTAFYEHRLDAVMRADGAIDWSRWADIPVLTRDELRNRRPEMLARRRPITHGATHDFSTTGSTGAPVTVAATRLANIVTRATTLRGHRWHGLDWSKNMVAWAGEEGSPARGGARYAGRWGPKWDPAATGDCWVINRSAPAEQVIAFAQEKRAAYLNAPPVWLQTLALDVLRRGDHAPFDKLMSYATGASDEQRDDCRRAFGAEIVSPYSSQEIGTMAIQCPAHGHFHVNAEAVLLEIVDDANRPVPPGTPGRILVTALHNSAQPMIRYDIGDLGVMGAACDCGRTLPVLEKIVGRTIHLFRFPDGVRLAPSLPNESRRLLGAQFWQMAQVAPLTVEVRYVPFPGASADEPAFADLVHRLVRSDLEVRFSREQAIRRAPGGKFIQYVCELPDGG